MAPFFLIAGFDTDDLNGVTHRFQLDSGYPRELSLRDGGDVSQAFTSKIREREIPQLLAQRAIVEWPYGSREELFDMCKESLYFAFRKTPLLK